MPTLRQEQLGLHLQQPLAGLYVVMGDEPLLALEATDAIRQTARQQGYSEREVWSVERGFDWQALWQSCRNQSLFGNRKLVECRLPNGKPGKEGGQILAALAGELASNHDRSCCLLITLPRLDKASQETAWFRQLQQQGQLISLTPPDHRQLIDWLAQRLARQQQHAKRPVLQCLADKVEGNLLAAHQEIQKMGLLFPAGEITLDNLQTAVLNVARYDVFKLSEAMLTGDRPRMLRMLAGLQGEGEAPVLVHWAMTEDIRQLIRFIQGRQQGQAVAQLARELRLWQGKERWMEQAARRLSMEQAYASLHYAAQVEKLIKGLRPPGLNQNIWGELTQLAMRIVNPALTLSV
ncbi:DNA polymerase III subunit delta [Parvibium lacunae]|uniref:DNA polymerase III subunit delta n=1 Tax=Parvibium lacunae TaxID=1888893 RepID=A0A368L4J0_9BURK|nr:DNA polymerase III subunit delta [Parvibium lacunae]RCS58489.1 DNA polymerase III subunit delta [Parvibium lacunae]